MEPEGSLPFSKKPSTPHPKKEKCPFKFSEISQKYLGPFCVQKTN
jgi:hypothetical protein